MKLLERFKRIPSAAMASPLQRNKKLAGDLAKCWTGRDLVAPGDAVAKDAGLVFGWPISRSALPLEGGLLLEARLMRANLNPRKLPRRAYALLLTENNRYRVGSNRLVHTDGDVTLVQGHLCNTGRVSAKELAAISDRLVAQLTEIVTRLYALNYISHGPYLVLDDL